MKRTRSTLGPQYVERVWLWTDKIDGAVNGSAARTEEGKRVMQPVELENKVALIVGGASEKGDSLAVSFAERGMDVAIVYYEGPVHGGPERGGPERGGPDHDGPVLEDSNGEGPDREGLDRDERARTIKRQVEELGRRCLLIRGGGSRSGDQDLFARGAVEQIMETLGRLDVFINLSERQFPLRAMGSDGSQAKTADTDDFFPDLKFMKAAMDEIVG